MLVALVAIALLIASVGAIYFLLKSMGQDGVEVAAPGSCRSGKCGVRKGEGTEANCHLEQDQFAAAEEVTGMTALEQQPELPEERGGRLG